VSSIITGGYGKRNPIVTAGYGGLLKEVGEIVKEVVTRYYPIDYKPFKKDITSSETCYQSLSSSFP
jgi:hypothetical protein